MYEILNPKNKHLLYLKRSAIFLCCIIIIFVITNVSNAETFKWSIGLHCKSNLPDPKLDSFFIIEEKRRFIRVAQFNNDIVDFSLPPIELQITPKEFYNRPEGLTINRETLAMKWRNSKKLCYLKDIKSIEHLAQEHLKLLLKHNKL